MSLPTWVPEIETKPAPIPLLVVQSFVNTWEGDSGADLLGDERSARRWLRDAGLLGGAGTEDVDLSVAREVRESIRAVLVHHGGGPDPTARALRPLAEVAEGCRLHPVLTKGGLIELEPDDAGQTAPMARILLIIRDAQRAGTWERLKACRNPDCKWAYYDRSHAGRGAWCDMSVCGNRIKNRNLRARRSTEGRRRRPGP
jgi:predicted RNA-binding Zn ribbon-like protein